MVFTPFRLRELELKNRWIMLAMHTGFATGNALTERDYAFYEERAKGGAAAVTVLLAVNEAGALKGDEACHYGGDDAFLRCHSRGYAEGYGKRQSHDAHYHSCHDISHEGLPVVVSER